MCLIIILFLITNSVESTQTLNLNKLSELAQFLTDFSSKIDSAQSIAAVVQIAATANTALNQKNNQFDKTIEVILKNALTGVTLSDGLEEKVQTIDEKLKVLDNLRNLFDQYVENYEPSTDATLKNFAEIVTSDDSHGVKATIDEIANNVAPDSTDPDDNFQYQLVDELRTYRSNQCNTPRPLHDHIYNIYSRLVATEVKGYIMSHFSFRVLELLGNSKSGSGKVELLDVIKNHVRNYMRVLRLVMMTAEKAVRPCDVAGDNRRGETYHELERFVTTIIAREEALTPQYHCEGRCEDRHAKVYALYDNPDERVLPVPGVRPCTSFGCYKSSHICTGHVFGCTAAADHLDICTNENDHSDPRRYYWFKDNSGVIYGDNSGGCKGTWRSAREGTSYGEQCDVCHCNCIENEQKYRNYFSLDAVVSDVSSNKVIIGLRLIRKDSVVHIQVQEGELGADGTITASSGTWKEPTAAVNKAALSPNLYAINLDRLIVPKNHILTGIKFDTVPRADGRGQAVELKIRATPFNYNDGKLTSNGAEVWISPVDMKKESKDYKKSRTQVPASNYLQNPFKANQLKLDLKPNKWIAVSTTGYKEDAGQTVIPLIDARSFVANPPLPLDGVQLYHKSADGYGGFIAVQAITLDRNRYMSDQ